MVAQDETSPDGTLALERARMWAESREFVELSLSELRHLHHSETGVVWGFPGL